MSIVLYQYILSKLKQIIVNRYEKCNTYYYYNNLSVPNSNILNQIKMYFKEEKKYYQ